MSMPSFHISHNQSHDQTALHWKYISPFDHPGFTTALIWSVHPVLSILFYSVLFVGFHLVGPYSRTALTNSFVNWTFHSIDGYNSPQRIIFDIYLCIVFL
jgi:hypothetical protein